MNAKLVYLTGGSFVSLLFGIIVTIILPAQEPAGPTELAKPYSEQEARGRDIYLREGCHYCHTQQVRAPEANRGFVRARGDIGPEPRLLGHPCPAISTTRAPSSGARCVKARI